MCSVVKIFKLLKIICLFTIKKLSRPLITPLKIKKYFQRGVFTSPYSFLLVMKKLFHIFRCSVLKSREMRIYAPLSRLFSYASRSFLVCFSFTLRSDFVPDRFQIGSSLVQSVFNLVKVDIPVAEGPPSYWADTGVVHPFPEFTKKLFKIFRINFNPEILNYRARPPRL